jgi:hypothetical protein
MSGLFFPPNKKSRGIQPFRSNPFLLIVKIPVESMCAVLCIATPFNGIRLRLCNPEI